MPIKNSLPIDPIYRSSRVYDSDQKVGKNEYKFDKKHPKPELNSNLEKPKKDKKKDENLEENKVKIFV